MSEGILCRNHIFLDAGSGDGRVVILVSLVFGLKAFGVEYDDVLWRRSLENVALFRWLYPDDKALPTILRGDFCEEMTYAPGGTAFKNFDVVFNYANDQHRLAAKIAQDGSENVLFISYGPSRFPESFPGLIPIMSLGVGTGSGSAGSYFHGYWKRG